MASHNDSSGTYFVQDQGNQEEFARIALQDEMATTGMGGVLPEQQDITHIERALDIACGTGGWLLEVAKTYPTIQTLIGVDINPNLIAYAREQATSAQVADRVEFQRMDALLILEFPSDFFDLVNIRFGSSFLRTWDWDKLLNEMYRVARFGGIIRVSEVDIARSTSPALNQLCERFLASLYQAGHCFSNEPDGVTKHIPALLSRYGIRDVQTKTHPIVYRAGTPLGEQFIQDAIHLYRTARPFLLKRGQMSDDYDEIYEQMLQDVKQPDFSATWTIVTAWGHKA